MLKQFRPDILIADGSDGVAAPGFRYPTRMAVIARAFMDEGAGIT